MQFIETVHGLVNRGVVLTALMVGLLAAGCGRPPQAPPPRPVPQVSTVTVQPEKVALFTELQGRASAFRVAQIRPQASGIVLKRLFKEGSDVKAGQVLYKIDPAPFQAALDNAEATLLSARTNAERARAALQAGIANVARSKATLSLAHQNRERFDGAYESRVVSAAQRDQAVTEVEVAETTRRAAEAQVESDRQAIAFAEASIQQAEAAVKSARINLGYCRVKAPISGRIGRSNVTEGAIVTAYQPIPMATVQQLDPIYADVPQSTSDLLRLKGRLKSGSISQNGTDMDKVKLILEDGTGYPQEGTLQFTDVTVNPTTGSVVLRVVFPNPEGTLLPGMFVRTVIEEGVHEQGILIPQQGVSRDHKGNPVAFIVDAESKAELRMLTLDRAIDNKWLVTAGLAPGDRVIVEGMQMLRPGTVVKAAPFKESGMTPENAARPAAGSN